MRVLRDAVLISAVVGYLIFAWVTLDRRSDEQRIAGLVADTVEAVNKRDLGGALRYVSRDYRGEDGLNRERLRMLAAQALRSEADFHASARIEHLAVRGEEATALVYASVEDEQGRALYARELTLSLVLEPARHALVFPVRAWRIKSVGNLGADHVF